MISISEENHFLSIISLGQIVMEASAIDAGSMITSLLID